MLHEAKEVKSINLDEENLLKLKITQCRLFAQKYMHLMMILFSIILGKRVIFDKSEDWHKLAFHTLE